MRELAQAADVLRHGLEEIAALAPEPGEDDALDTQAKRLGDADALRAAADAARLALVGDVTGDLGGGELPQDAATALATAERALAGSDDPTLVLLAQDLADAVAVVSDVAGAAGRLRRRPRRRPGAAGRGARPPGGDHRAGAQVRRPGEGLAGVLAWAADAEARLSQLDVSDEALEALQARARRRPRAAGRRSPPRSPRGAGPRPTGFAAEVGAELAGLAMKSARVSFSIDSDPDEPGPDGRRRGGAAARRAPRRAGAPGAQGRLGR